MDTRTLDQWGSCPGHGYQQCVIAKGSLQVVILTSEKKPYHTRLAIRREIVGHASLEGQRSQIKNCNSLHRLGRSLGLSKRHFNPSTRLKKHFFHVQRWNYAFLSTERPKCCRPEGIERAGPVLAKHADFEFDCYSSVFRVHHRRRYNSAVQTCMPELQCELPL